MAVYQDHITFSAVVALVYSVIGIYLFGVSLDLALLSGIILLITGLLPNIDEDSSAPARELGSLLAAVCPIVLMEFFPGIKAEGSARTALVVIVSYAVTRLVIVRGLQAFTVHRGIIHSIPAAILVFEIIYMMFWDLGWESRMYVSIAAFIGYMSHLGLDAYGNLDIVGKAMGKARKQTSVMKFFGPKFGPTLVVYIAVFYLGYYVLRDMHPHLARVMGI